MKDYVVLDLENPNFRQNSISAVGIILVRDNKVVEKIYSLINPEDTFDRINMDITKIAPHMVKDSPTLPEFWPKIRDFLTNNIVVGHNITYDLKLISKSLQRYQIPVPDFKYICTLQLSRRFLDLPSYKLENIAKKLHIIYNPHNAIEDARAAYELFEYLNRHQKIDGKQSKHYHYVPKVVEKYDPKLSTNLNNLYGMVRVILFEEYITEAQFKLFEKWYDDNRLYSQYLIFHKINLQLKKILDKGHMDAYDKKELVNVVEFISVSSIYSKKTLKVQVLQGIIKAITADGKVTLEELTNLKRWMLRHTSLSGSYPYDKILKITNVMLKQGFITFDEQKEISKQLKELITPIKSTDEKFILKNRTFCLSGEFKHGSKEKITYLLEKEGAIQKSSVSSKVDYLFVGDLGSPAWKYGNIGGKIVKAQRLQDNGESIKIISETNLFKILKY